MSMQAVGAQVLRRWLPGGNPSGSIRPPFYRREHRTQLIPELVRGNV